MNITSTLINGQMKYLRNTCRLAVALTLSLTGLNAVAVSPPTAFNLSIVAGANLSTPIVLKGTDPNGFPLTFKLVSLPSHGTLSGTTPNLVYTPALNFLGADSFRYVVTDGFFTSTAATVSISVKHALSINNIRLTEGLSGTKSATFTVTMTVPGSELNLVLVSYRTVDGSAKAGSDYQAVSGTLIFGETTAQTISVPVFGDRTIEFSESFSVQLFNPTSNAVIVHGTGVCTIADDDSTLVFRVGTAELTPADSVVGVGDPVNLSLAWTHPIGWRKLDSIDLLIVDDQDASLATRWNEAANSFSLFSPAANRFVRTAAAESRAQFETPLATLYLQESTGGGPAGKTVTVEYSLSFKPQAAGRTFSIEALATDDDGVQQGWEPVGKITVLPR